MPQVVAPDSPDELSPSGRAAARVEFQLTYARSPVGRVFSEGSLTGPDIPCAYGSDEPASGGWEDGGDFSDVTADRTEEEWVDRFAKYAVTEAIHEALEWLTVDSQRWLNPHGSAEEEIYALTDEFVRRLTELRAGHRGVTDDLATEA